MTDQDIYFFREGTHGGMYRNLGCQIIPNGGARFSVWAPNARAVSVIGDWNEWDRHSDLLAGRPDSSGIWEGTVPGVVRGQTYKYRIETGRGIEFFEKADPFAICSECPPGTASRVWDLDYPWGDSSWMSTRAKRNDLNSPISIYEVHAGSWRRKDGSFLGYRELARQLADYMRDTGFTHVELMPLTEHPFYGSWGYQTTGYFAPTARYGTPQDFMYLIDHLHQNGVGVILDWVPSHFPSDGHGLAYFDGTHLYEHADAKQGFHPEWNSYIFNYGRNEVRSFLLSSAMSWLDRYHVDGLRVDAVASMLYLDYARKDDGWIPNRHGGRENLEAIEFLRVLNTAVYREHPDVMSIAEESTAWPMVSRPIHLGGLGFGMKWNMGWMHDTLAYMREDPINRKYHHGKLTFSLLYAFNENFILPLSHDEVVYGKGSLLGKMPGDSWQQFANLRALYGYMWAHPGKKLLFMGGEFGQRREWTHEGELEWEMARLPGHAGIHRWVCDLNRFYRDEPALWQSDFDGHGFEWIEANDSGQSIIAMLRKPGSGGRLVAAVSNLTPIPRENYSLGVPRPGRWSEVLNSDAAIYGGAGWGNLGGIDANPVGAHGRPFSLNVTLPPLATIFLRSETGG